MGCLYKSKHCSACMAYICTANPLMCGSINIYILINYSVTVIRYMNDISSIIAVINVHTSIR